MSGYGRKLRPQAWAVSKRVVVRDPDGWRGADARSWFDPITEEEFDRRAACSTIEQLVESPPQDAEATGHGEADDVAALRTGTWAAGTSPSAKAMAAHHDGPQDREKAIRGEQAAVVGILGAALGYSAHGTGDHTAVTLAGEAAPVIRLGRDLQALLAGAEQRRGGPAEPDTRDAITARIVAEVRRPLVMLLEQALHLRMIGERAPGAGPWPAETWPDWDRRAEAVLRGLHGDAAPKTEAKRCRNCDHFTSDHREDGCWYTLNYVRSVYQLCQCAYPRDKAEQERP